MLGAAVNPSGISFEISGVKIITDGDKPGMAEREHPLYEIAGLNAVTARLGEVFYDDTVDLPSLDHRQKLLYRL